MRVDDGDPDALVKVPNSGAASLLIYAHLGSRAATTPSYGYGPPEYFAPRWARDVAVKMLLASPPIEAERMRRFMHHLRDDYDDRVAAHFMALAGTPEELRDLLGNLHLPEYRRAGDPPRR